MNAAQIMIVINAASAAKEILAWQSQIKASLAETGDLPEEIRDIFSVRRTDKNAMANARGLACFVIDFA